MQVRRVKLIIIVRSKKTRRPLVGSEFPQQSRDVREANKKCLYLGKTAVIVFDAAIFTLHYSLNVGGINRLFVRMIVILISLVAILAVLVPGSLSLMGTGR